jgi:hypothetical protein
MAAPNVVNVTTITGKTDVLDVGTTASAITSNASASGKVYKINSLIVSNIDDDSGGEITVDLFRSSTAYKIASKITVPVGSTLVLISKDTSIYLEEGDELRCTAANANYLKAICSYEIIDDA